MRYEPSAESKRDTKSKRDLYWITYMDLPLCGMSRVPRVKETYTKSKRDLYWNTYMDLPLKGPVCLVSIHKAMQVCALNNFYQDL